MSDSPDHKHEPGHGHEHGPAPKRTHAHTQDEQALQLEDAGTRALSDALSSSFKVVKVIMIVMVVIFLGSGIREVGSFEKAVKLRFGKPVGFGEEALLDAGWHWAWPYPIEEIVKIPIGQVQEIRSTIGFYFIPREFELTDTEPPMGSRLNPVLDGYLITGDGNIMHARANLRYRITDAVTYAFANRNASNLVQNALNNALQYAASGYRVDDAVRKDVSGYRATVLRRVNELVTDQNLGVTVETMDLTVIPPRQVRNSFEAVTSAEQKRSQLIDDARAERNRLLATAEGESEAIINRGKTDATRSLQAINAEAQYFLDQLPHYEANPELYVTRLQANTVGRVMTNVADKILQTRTSPGNRREIRMQLNPEPRRAEPAPQ